VSQEQRIIKKYPNRRLYDTATSGYITLADVKKMILDHVDFKVIDAKTNEDLTRTILLQIILEEESGGMPMFSSEMLAQMIRFYGHAMQGVMGTYLERNLQSFLQIQNKLQEQTKNLYGDASMLTPEVWKQFLQMQAPGMQGMIGNYLEQSAKVFLEMQEQMRKQARGMFGAFQFPGFPGAPAGAGEDKDKK
jgi:polyhydroxyalkanoate synthesis repressor PhaR